VRDTITIHATDGRSLLVRSRRTGKLLTIDNAVDGRRVQRLAFARHGLTTEMRRGKTVLAVQTKAAKTPAEPPKEASVAAYAPPTEAELAEIEEIG
jgi:hypothetical protein